MNSCMIRRFALNRARSLHMSCGTLNQLFRWATHRLPVGTTVRWVLSGTQWCGNRIKRFPERQPIQWNRTLLVRTLLHAFMLPCFPIVPFIKRSSAQTCKLHFPFCRLSSLRNSFFWLTDVVTVGLVRRSNGQGRVLGRIQNTTYHY